MWAEIRDARLSGRDYHTNVVGMHRGAFITLAYPCSGPGEGRIARWCSLLRPYTVHFGFHDPNVYRYCHSFDEPGPATTSISIFTREGADRNEVLIAILRRSGLLSDPSVNSLDVHKEDVC